MDAKAVAIDLSTFGVVVNNQNDHKYNNCDTNKDDEYSIAFALLKESSAVPEMFSVFKAQKITNDVITELDSNDINYLFQNVTVGEKLKFQKALKKLIASVVRMQSRLNRTPTDDGDQQSSIDDFNLQAVADNEWCKNFEDTRKNDPVPKWRSSAHLRYQEIKNEKLEVHHIFNRYKVLNRCQQAHYLISMDFEVLVPEKHQKLFQKWNKFIEKIVPILIAANTSVEGWVRLDLLMDDIDGNARDCLIMSYLSLILPAKKQLKYQDNKGEIKFWRPTEEEVTNSIILVVEEESMLTETLNDREAFNSNFQLKDVPFIVVIGKMGRLDKFFVHLNSRLFETKCFLEAVDTLFKAFYVLQIEYPLPCAQIWMFIQQFFYEIEPNTCVKGGQHTALINKLNEPEVMDRKS